MAFLPVFPGINTLTGNKNGLQENKLWAQWLQLIDAFYFKLYFFYNPITPDNQFNLFIGYL